MFGQNSTIISLFKYKPIGCVKKIWFWDGLKPKIIFTFYYYNIILPNKLKIMRKYYYCNFSS